MHMVPPFSPPLLALTLWGLCCALRDARSRRIGNALLWPAALAALLVLVVLRESVNGAGPWRGVAAGLLALLFTLPGYARGRLGGADVKLLFILALATDPFYLLFTLGGAALFCVLWLLAAGPAWRCLPAGVRSRMPALAPPVVTPPYATFVFLGMLCADLLT
jgi:prepilin peptidase CpaA